MVSTVNLGLAIGCLIIAGLMAALGSWFIWVGIRDRDAASIFLSLLIFGLAAFAAVGAYNLFLTGFYMPPK